MTVPITNRNNPPDPQFVLTKTLLKCASRPTMTGGHSYLGCALGKVYRPLGLSKICHSGQRLEGFPTRFPSASWIQSTAFCENTLILRKQKNNGETHQNQGRCLQKNHDLSKILAKPTNHWTDLVDLAMLDHKSIR